MSKEFEDIVGIRYNKGKNMLHLIEPGFLEAFGSVLTFGASKYAADNWKYFDETQQKEIVGSLMRHLEAYRRGEKIDPESNLEHLSHMVCNIMFLWYYDNKANKSDEEK